MQSSKAWNLPGKSGNSYAVGLVNAVLPETGAGAEARCFGRFDRPSFVGGRQVGSSLWPEGRCRAICRHGKPTSSNHDPADIAGGRSGSAGRSAIGTRRLCSFSARRVVAGEIARALDQGCCIFRMKDRQLVAEVAFLNEQSHPRLLCCSGRKDRHPGGAQSQCPDHCL